LAGSKDGGSDSSSDLFKSGFSPWLNLEMVSLTARETNKYLGQCLFDPKGDGLLAYFWSFF